jgi:hypothetical protein
VILATAALAAVSSAHYRVWQSRRAASGAVSTGRR